MIDTSRSADLAHSKPSLEASAGPVPTDEAPGSPDDSGFEMTHWRSDLYDLELPHDPLLSLLPEMSSPPKGWSWDMLSSAAPAGAAPGSSAGGPAARTVQSGWAAAAQPQAAGLPVEHAPLGAPCAPVRVTLTSAAGAPAAPFAPAQLPLNSPTGAPPLASPTGSLAALNTWRAAAGCALAAPAPALPFGAVSQRFFPATPPAGAWRARGDAPPFSYPVVSPRDAPALGTPAAPARRLPEPPALRPRSKRQRAGQGRAADADYLFYDEEEAPPALRSRRGAGGLERAVAVEEAPGVADSTKRARVASAGAPAPGTPLAGAGALAVAPQATKAPAPGRDTAAKGAAGTPSRQVQEHEVVWARLPGFPWWPAQVQPPQGEHEAAPHKPGDVLCVFYGQGDYAWLPRGQVRPFACAEYASRAARKDVGLQKALLAAWDALGLARPMPDAAGKVQLPFELDAPVIPYDEEQ